MSSLITISYSRIASSDLTGSGWGTPGVSARWDSHPRLRNRRRPGHCVNFVVLLAGWVRWDTRGCGTCPHNGKFQTLQLAPGRPSLAIPSDAMEFRCQLSQTGVYRETGRTYRTAVWGQSSSPAPWIVMTAARGLRPARRSGPGSHDLQQGLTVGLIQVSHVRGWLRRWERALTVDLDVIRIRLALADVRESGSPHSRCRPWPCRAPFRPLSRVGRLDSPGSLP